MLPYVRLLQYAAHEIVFRTAHVQAFVVQFQAIVFLYESLVTKPILAEVSTLCLIIYIAVLDSLLFHHLQIIEFSFHIEKRKHMNVYAFIKRASPGKD